MSEPLQAASLKPLFCARRTAAAPKQNSRGYPSKKIKISATLVLSDCLAADCEKLQVDLHKLYWPNIILADDLHAQGLGSMSQLLAAYASEATYQVPPVV